MRRARAGRRFSTNSAVTEYLQAAMRDAGVDVRKRRRRPCIYKSGSRVWSLGGCIGSNEGLLVFEDEACEISAKVAAALPCWTAAPKRRKGKLVWLTVTVGRGRSARRKRIRVEEWTGKDLRREAAEVGCDPFLLRRVCDFVAFCAESSTRGGCYIT